LRETRHAPEVVKNVSIEGKRNVALTDDKQSITEQA